MLRGIVWRVLFSVVALVTMIGIVPASGGAAAAVPAYTWVEAHGNPQLTGVSQDPTISVKKAPGLGVHWMVNLTAPSLTSPVVGYNQALGQTLAYAGTEAGTFSAFNASSGATVWSVNLGSAVRMTPVIDGPYIWVASTYSPQLYKLDASTGAELCQTPIFAVAEASPIVVTPPGGSPTVYMGSNDTGLPGPVYSINEANCAVNWAFTNYAQVAGVWDFISYAVDATGEPLVLFGTSDPDAAVYALDAVTGAEVWRFATYNPNNGPADVGAGVTIASPGTAAGGADGAAFVPSKDGNLYALDLTTGAQRWVYNYAGQFPPVGNGSRSTAALSGTQLVFGTTTGTFSVNALTGALLWHYVLPNGDENLGAVAISGPAGGQVVLTTNVDGQFQVLSLATGTLLYSYQMPSYLASSPAVFSGNVLVTAADGFLYDFALGGSNSAAPSTSVTSPAQGSVVAYPRTGKLLVNGTASDPTGVQQVAVTVQEDGQTGPWWSATKKAWTSGPFNNQAKLTAKGATTTGWSLVVPIAARGGLIEVRASAVNSGHIADTSADQSQAVPSRADFTVSPSTTAPTLALGVTRAAPASQITLTGGGFAAGESVSVTLPTSPVTTLATIAASSTGSLPATPATVPTGLDFGPIDVIATGQTSGRSASAPLTISNNWDQYGATSAKTSFEVNDSALNNNVAASGRFYLNQAYNFPTVSPVQSSVAIDNGHAFFGDNGGNFYSINVATGAPTWQDTYTGGIDSSAAVDSGMVMFGTEAGAVVAVNELTGAAIWSTPTGGPVESSPAVSNGVVYVGCDNGVLYALNEQTGAVLWSTTLAGPVHSSPVVDPNHQTVVIGDNTGRVTAVSIGGTGRPAAGTVVWSAVTGGPVTATPTYFSNDIFVGSSDSNEYAFNGGTGALLWTFKTGAAITANNVTFGQDIGVGSQDGTVYYLSAANGSVQNSLVGTVPIVGLAGAINFVVATLSNGAAFASRITGIDQTWKYNTTGTGFASSPVLNNGNVYITGLDSNLHVFSAPGRLVY